jgi:transcriptional regulator
MTLYVPEQFRLDDFDAQVDFIRGHGFADLISANASGEIEVSHVPLLPRVEEPGRLRLLGHLARANPHWQGLESAASLLAVFWGPHAYVSPSWYANHPSVPTWNYAVVHARGRARLVDEAELHETLMELSAVYENGRPNPWRMSELPAAYVDSMLKHIVGFEIEVETLEAKFKLSQNRPAEVPRVIAALEAEGEGATAALMRAHAPTAKA